MKTPKQIVTAMSKSMINTLKSDDIMWKFTNPFYYPFALGIILLMFFLLPATGFLYHLIYDLINHTQRRKLVSGRENQVN